VDEGDSDSDEGESKEIIGVPVIDQEKGTGKALN
jgi:hypothetical protein